MFVGGDYQFEMYNFVGINIRYACERKRVKDFTILNIYIFSACPSLCSVLASLFYSYFKFREQQHQKSLTAHQSVKSANQNPPVASV